MSKGSAPSAPDPYTSAAAQYQYGTAAADYNAALNRVNTSGPGGSTSYNVTGYDPQTGAPIYSQNTQLAPGQQQMFDASTAVKNASLTGAGTLAGQFNNTAASGAPNTAPIISNVGRGGLTAVDTSGVPQIADVSGLYDKSYNTALAGEQAAVDPSMQAEKEQLDASLRNSGAHPGDPAYDNAMAQLDARQANANTQAAGAAASVANNIQSTNYGESANTNQQLFGENLSTTQAKNQVQNQDFTQGLANAQLNNQSGSDALSQWASKLGIPLTEMQAILGGSQPNTPNAVAPSQANASTPDIMSAFTNQYNGQLAGYNANVASANADTSAGAGLAGAAAIALDF